MLPQDVFELFGIFYSSIYPEERLESQQPQRSAVLVSTLPACESDLSFYSEDNNVEEPMASCPQKFI
jgi:hypothetical protein